VTAGHFKKPECPSSNVTESIPFYVMPHLFSSIFILFSTGTHQIFIKYHEKNIRKKKKKKTHRDVMLGNVHTVLLE
jgi:hypothetical protein